MQNCDRAAGIITFLLLGAACSGTEGVERAEPDASRSQPASCGKADWLASLHGQHASGVATNLRSNGKLVRVIHPGDAVTLDHNPRRLNLVVDGSGAITDATCG